MDIQPAGRITVVKAAGLVVVLSLVAWATVSLGAQAVTVSRMADAVVVKAPAFTFIKGDPLVRLKEGRSVRVDLDLALTPGPDDAAAARSRQTFILSYDLWEERFAVTLVGPPSKSAAYLTATGAETWCVEQMTVPVAALGNLGRSAPFWIRLEYRILDGDAPNGDDTGAGFTLRGLIDALSARRQAAALTHSISAGPFRLRP